MASEIRVSCSLVFHKGAHDGVEIGPLLVTMTGSKFIHARQAIGTAAEAIVLGEVAPGGWAVFVNRDTVNFVTIMAASGATPLARLKAGEHAHLRLDPTATAPFAKADTAAVELEYLIVSD